MAKQHKSKIPGKLRFDHPLAWFTDPANIPNQELVQQTIQWFETGPGKRAFTTLEFLNLLYKQFRFTIDNIYNAELVRNHFINLPLSRIQKHILTGFVLKWTGGYPIHSAEREQEPTLKAIEDIFLTAEPDSPEREFCKADMNERKRFMKLGLALTAAINNGIDVNEFLKEMDDNEHDKQYERFEDLFREAVLMEAVGPFKNKAQYLIQEKSSEYGFSCWLTDFKGWSLGDETTYKQFLNRSTLLEYLRYDKKQRQLKQNKFDEEKALWNQDNTKKPTADDYMITSLSSDDSIVRKHLSKLREMFQTGEQFDHTVNSIAHFLKTRETPRLEQVFLRNGANKKLAFTLGEIWRDSFNEAIPLSYLKMCKGLFSVFSRYEIEDSTYKSSNLYKYFITAT